jgi:hypothetical protein
MCPRKLIRTELKAARQHLAVAELCGLYMSRPVNSVPVSCAFVMPASAASSGAIPRAVIERAVHAVWICWVYCAWLA